MRELQGAEGPILQEPSRPAPLLELRGPSADSADTAVYPSGLRRRAGQFSSSRIRLSAGRHCWLLILFKKRVQEVWLNQQHQTSQLRASPPGAKLPAQTPLFLSWMGSQQYLWHPGGRGLTEEPQVFAAWLLWLPVFSLWKYWYFQGKIFVFILHVKKPGVYHTWEHVG